MSIRITCITKPDRFSPHEAISHYGWIEDKTNNHGITDRQTVVNWVKNGTVAYVRDGENNIVKCFVNTSRSGTEFLQTYSDGEYTDNLLSLIAC